MCVCVSVWYCYSLLYIYSQNSHLISQQQNTASTCYLTSLSWRWSVRPDDRLWCYICASGERPRQTGRKADGQADRQADRQTLYFVCNSLHFTHGCLAIRSQSYFLSWYFTVHWTINSLPLVYFVIFHCFWTLTRQTIRLALLHQSHWPLHNSVMCNSSIPLEQAMSDQPPPLNQLPLWLKRLLYPKISFMAFASQLPAAATATTTAVAKTAAAGI